MKSHEKKVHEKEVHKAELERNDLYAWGQNLWTRAKSGDLITRRFAIIAVIIGAAAGLAYWAFSGRGAGSSAVWRELESDYGNERLNTEKLNKFAQDHPNDIQGRVAKLQVARQMLGPLGLELMPSITQATRAKGIRSVEEAREIFLKLADEFKDVTFQAQAIDGAAHAELALVGVPREGIAVPIDSIRPEDCRGSVDKAIDLFRRYAKLVGENAGASAKKMADDLEANKVSVFVLGKDLSKKLQPLTFPPPVNTPNLPPGLTPTPPGPTPPK